jgi:hypothetical protein
MLFFYWLSLVWLLEVQSQSWSISNLQSQPLVPEKASLELLAERRIIEVSDWGCLFSTDHAGASSNPWHGLENSHEDALKDPAFFKGTTVWINEWMSVGHMMYDIQLLQVLQSHKVDRIIIQRAACVANNCNGVGSFDGFYKGLYISMIDAFQSEIPIFIRWAWNSKYMQPVYVGSANPSGYITVPAERMERGFGMKSGTCLQRVIRNPARCQHCFHNSISSSAVVKFKEVAYSMIVPADISRSTKKWLPVNFHNETASIQSTGGGNGNPPKVVPKLPSFFPRGGPIVVTLAHRGVSASRHLDNIPLLVKVLQQHLTEPMFEFRVVDTTDSNRGFQEQIRFVAESQVIIAEHGAFQSHVVYLRNGSLLVDIIGTYSNGEISHFRNVAQMFGVFYASVVNVNLLEHVAQASNLTESACVEVAAVVLHYALERPFQFNVA